MTADRQAPSAAAHSHVFLGTGHARNERKTWGVIALCAAMMVLEIGGGSLFGSLALVADGLHMSTHAAALLIAASPIPMRAAMRTTRPSPSAPASWAISPAFPVPSFWR
jgi:Co/Zn/Cd efflux system component